MIYYYFNYVSSASYIHIRVFDSLLLIIYVYNLFCLCSFISVSIQVSIFHLILILYMYEIYIYIYISFSNWLYCITKFYLIHKLFLGLKLISHCSSAWLWISLHHVCLGNSLNKILNFWTELICSVNGACSFRKSNKWNASSQPTLECYWLALQSVNGTKAGMCFQYESIFRRIIHLGDLFHKKTFTKKSTYFPHWSKLSRVCDSDTYVSSRGQDKAPPAQRGLQLTLLYVVVLPSMYVFCRQTRSAEPGQEDIWMVKVNVG